jgi:site-specific recombinase XerD
MTEHASGYELVLSSKWNPASRRNTAARAAHDLDTSTLLELLVLFMTQKSSRKANTSKATLSLYEQGVRRWLEWCTGSSEEHPNRIELLRATDDDLETWLAFLQQRGRAKHAHRDAAWTRREHAARTVNGAPLRPADEKALYGLAPATISAYLTGVRTLYRALRWCGALERDPTELVKPPQNTAKRDAKPVLEREKLETLERLPSERDNAFIRARDEALIALLATRGLRGAEVTALEVDSLEGKVLVVRGKGDQVRRLPLTNHVLSSLKVWLGHRAELEAKGKINSSAMFVSLSNRAFGQRLRTDGLRQILNAYFSSAGLSVGGLHVLRRTFATEAYHETGDLKFVKEVMGHADIGTTDLYAQSNLRTLEKKLERFDGATRGSRQKVVDEPLT